MDTDSHDYLGLACLHLTVNRGLYPVLNGPDLAVAAINSEGQSTDITEEYRALVDAMITTNWLVISGFHEDDEYAYVLGQVSPAINREWELLLAIADKLGVPIPERLRVKTQE